MQSDTAVKHPAPDAPIVGHVTRWYYRRMGLLSAMLLGMGLYFLYDGAFGYPKANAVAEKKEWFENVVLKSFDEAQASNRIPQWKAEAAAKGWPTGRGDEPPRWVAWAAEQGLPEKPHKYTEREISDQFWWGGGTILAALIVAINLLLNRSKTIRAGADHWVTPEGKTVKFSDVFRLDTRKWRHKGLAYAWYREGGTGPERRAILDDLKFSHTHQILDRLRLHFKGELIEKVEDDPPNEEQGQQAETGPTSKPS